MKYSGPYDSKPVVGKEAEKLAHAMRTGGYVTNPQAEKTIKRIIEKRKRVYSSDAQTRNPARPEAER